MEVIYLKVFLFILTTNIFLQFLLKLFGFKVDRSGLYCGITAFCGARPVDANLIKIIMMFNESRGEDGTGWAVNNVVKKDTEKVSKFLQLNNLVVSPNDENYTIVAHARKSSSGTKNNKELVHPFSIYKDSVEKEKPDLILAMNGTLSNTELMASTFNIEYKNYTNSDTQMLARAMAKLGDKEYIKAIEGYEGTATLVFFTPKNANTLMVYRDTSRPIYYWNKKEDEMYISSMDEALLAIGAYKEEIFIFESEMLYKIQKGKIKKKEKIERNPLKPKKIYSSNGSSSFHNNSKRGTYEGVYNGYDSYEEYERSCELVYSSPLSNNSNKDKKVKNPHSGKGNLVYCVVDKYYRNGHLCTGMLIMNESGEVKKENIEDEKYKKYFFINGYLCKDESNYNKLMNKCSEKNGFDIKTFKSLLLSSIVEYLRYPITTIVDSKEKWILNSDYSTKIKALGDKIQLDILLSPNVVTLKYNGEFTATTMKDIADVVHIGEKKVSSEINKDVNTLEQLNKSVNLTDQHTGLIRLLKTDQRKAFRSNYLYTLMRTDVYKCNPFPELKVQFYLTLLKELYNFSVISEKFYSQLVDDGEKCGFTEHSIIESIDKEIETLCNKINNVKQKEEVNTEASTESKIALLDNANSTFTEEEVILSISKSNKLFNNNQFNNDILDYNNKPFEQFIQEWVPVDNEQANKTFFEAVCLCLNKIDFLTNSELLEVLDNNYLNLAKKTQVLWESWIKSYDESSQNGIINEEKINDNDGIIDDGITNEQFEENCKDDINIILESMKAYVQEIEQIDPDYRTKWVNTSIIQIEAAMKYIEKYLFKIEKQENETKQ